MGDTVLNRLFKVHIMEKVTSDQKLEATRVSHGDV